MSCVKYEVRVFSDGDKYWYQYGKLHRTDGLAIELIDGNCGWFLNGKELTEDQFNNQSFMEIAILIG